VTGSDASTPEVAVVIVNFRSTDVLMGCLESLERQRSSGPAFRVLICENGSGDGSDARLISEIPRRGWSGWVDLVISTHNRGFTGGNNVLLHRIIERRPDVPFVLLLNPDTVVHPHAIERLHATMLAHPDWGVAGPGIHSPDGSLQTSCFNDPSPLGEFLRSASLGFLDRRLARFRTSKIPPHSTGPHDWTSFAAAMIRTDALRQIGVFDEGFFAYYDDPDLCGRIRRAGWVIGHCPEAAVIHLEGFSTGIQEIRRDRRRLPAYQRRGRARYFAKHDGVIGLWLANLAWQIGRLISWSKDLLLRRPPTGPIALWKDHWIDALHPWSTPHLPFPPLEESTSEVRFDRDRPLAASSR